VKFDPAGEIVLKVQGAASQVIKDTIGEVARVLIPAIASAATGALSGVTVTVGPITIEPIKITIGMEDKP
jgi:hypothetical protein